ncbi:DUF4870 domain-containing protein [Herbiconiux sp. KACC 21604]|uniref:DUF4870 domain-containing protein n=1 Tax=unclassified Herbiconiux TaxID=2618217 RepID=UPI001491EED8|nr:DUF4870 domain-containing protein [Herbiconiux sp. SALV-R1]QJU52218.1 DUF4870 domain-containing protein [Herbiconiux sp. SALV-R1]WPO87061.1 DUF4870 domain-containing protein [Herbiconiux sp. KACC 21604]
MTTATPLTAQDEKTWIPLAHYSGVLSFVGPLIVLLVQKNRSAAVEREAKESLNAQITVALAALVLYTLGGVLAFVLVGFVFLLVAPLVQLAGVVLAIIAGVKAGQTGTFRYPLTLRLLK